MFPGRLIKRLPLLVILVISLCAAPVLAQDDSGLILNLSRTFGYSSGTGDIQGTFTLKASGPKNLTKVVFLIDGQSMGEVTAPPFNLRFSTDDYSLGRHTLSATGYTSDGAELKSNEQVREFVPASAAIDTVMKIILPLFAVIALAALISYGIPWLLGRNKTKSLQPGAARNYGLLGGAICPKCSRPFSMHAYGLNLLVGKYDRCPYCGRWSLVTRANPAALAAAEEAELAAAFPSPVQSTENKSDEQLKQDLESSRFENL